MRKGQEHFEHFLQELETLLKQASREKNPALYLYRQPTRTHLFMLEGLCRCFGNLHNRKRFDWMRHEFKSLEDALGAIDYYDDIAQKIAANKKIPAPVKQYLQAQTREKIQHLNDLLEQEAWIGHSPKKLRKIRKKLASATRSSEREEIKAIRDYYISSINSISAFLKKTGPVFSDMENDVHEFRRKIRWLSIYPHALRGGIQFGEPEKMPAHMKKYMTKETLDSRYNVFPAPDGSRHILLLNKHAFLSLSWLIAELGRLKDSGLMVMGIREALMQHTPAGKDDVVLERIYTMLGNGQKPLNVLLKESAEICHRFSEEQVLNTLVTGIKKPGNEKPD
jgi:hypothetical protein